MSILSTEKDTDRCMSDAFIKAFNEPYNTKSDADLFTHNDTLLKPDGWYWLDDSTLLIIENKHDIKKDKQAREQARLYASTAYHNSPAVSYIICVNGFGCDSSFTYFMYEYTRTDELKRLPISTLQELHDIYTPKPKNPSTKQKGCNLKAFHDQIVHQTQIEDVANLSIITSFLILCAKFPDIKAVLDSSTVQELLFQALKRRFERFYGEFPIIQTQFHHPVFKTLNFTPLIKMILDTHFVSLNDLYAQFCKYAQPNKNIVLTPPDIIDLMKDCLSKYKYSTVCDPFAGTSELLLCASPESHKIAIEISDYMHLMSKINFEINDIKNYELIKGDSSKINFHADVAITNPPYTKNVSKKSAIEWLSTLIDKVDVIIAIIPTTNLNNSKDFNKWKKVLLDNGYYVRRIINCGKCFHKVGVLASIIVIDDIDEKTPYKLFDGEMKKTVDIKQIPHVGRVLKPSGQAKIDDIKNDIGFELIEDYDHETNWGESHEQKQRDEEMKLTKTKDDEFKESVFQQLEQYFSSGCGLNHRRFGRLFETLNMLKHDDPKYASDSTVKIVFGKLFEQIKFKPRTISQCNEVAPDEGYPLISASYKNNGICCYIDSFDFDGQYLSVAKGGSDGNGTAFYQHGKFSMTGATLLFQLKEEFQTTFENNESICLAFAEYLTEQKHYDYQNTAHPEDILQTIVEIPNKDPVLQIIPNSVYETEEMINLRIGDILEPVKGKKRIIYECNEVAPDKGYPLISASCKNNGISCYIDQFDYEGQYLSITKNGVGAGTAFYQNGKFSITSDVLLFKFIQEIENELIYKRFVDILTSQLSVRFDYQNKPKLDKILNFILSITSTDPVFQTCPELMDLAII